MPKLIDSVSIINGKSAPSAGETAPPVAVSWVSPKAVAAVQAEPEERQRVGVAEGRDVLDLLFVQARRAVDQRDDFGTEQHAPEAPLDPELEQEVRIVPARRSARERGTLVG